MTALKTAEPKVTLFDFKGHPFQVVTFDGEPWFVAKQVRELLDIQQGGANLSYLDASEKMTLNRGQTSVQTLFKPSEGRGGARRLNLIAESGLYKTVLRSDKPKAKEFQNWVTKEVLPSIRKDGGYVMGEEKLATGEMTEGELVLTAMRMMEDKVARYPATICQ
ncbi:BRO family protein [Kaistia defluvii]|uniref:BRO-N domain-containing protein n=1 Tax=Kaistia defluvii TaxID=410841 RepID=UPI002251AA69|nr:BRO family protein [Kaistia defluvii]MCX5518074.1 BRO family protein [Kaistia defluvii]